jgi:hypothetical protein
VQNLLKHFDLLLWSRNINKRYSLTIFLKINEFQMIFHILKRLCELMSIIPNSIERWEKAGSVAKETLLDGDEKSGAIQATNILYCAPELLQNREQNKRRAMNQNW